MDDESKELVIRISRPLTWEEEREIQYLIKAYPRQNGSVEIGFF